MISPQPESCESGYSTHQNDLYRSHASQGLGACELWTRSSPNGLLCVAYQGSVDGGESP